MQKRCSQSAKTEGAAFFAWVCLRLFQEEAVYLQAFLPEAAISTTACGGLRERLLGPPSEFSRAAPRPAENSDNGNPTAVRHFPQREKSDCRRLLPGKAQINLRKKRCSQSAKTEGAAFLHDSGKSKISMGLNQRFYQQRALLFCNSLFFR